MATVAGGRTAVAKADTAASHPYSCNTCQVAFRNIDLQKNHMKGDWHRYNLKRRVASLPPISAELFAEKVLQSRASSAAEAGRASFERVCHVCQKTYFSENSFQNHISSQKHKAREAVLAARGGGSKGKGKEAEYETASTVLSSTFSLGEPLKKGQTAASAATPAASTVADTEHQLLDSDAEEEFTQVVEGLKKASLAEDGPSPVKRPGNPRLSAAAQRKGEHPVAVPASDAASSSASAAATPAASKASEPAASLRLCLFCNYASPTVALNVAHMERFHGMFIPEKPYLVDLEGLLGQLEQRIREDHECIYCGKIRGDVFATQTHMRDKAHCKIPYTTLEEQVDIGDFYDFRGSYSDSETEGEDEEDEEEDAEEEAATAAGPSTNGAKLRAKLGAKRTTTTTTRSTTAVDSSEEDGPGKDVDEGGDGWETDSSASSLDSADLTAVPADNHIQQYERLDKHPHHSQTDPRAHHQMDGWHSHAHKHAHAVFYDEYELHLPSGRSVGHRSLNRYFRQNLRHYPSPSEREQMQRLALEEGTGGAASEDDMSVDAEEGEGADGETAVARTNGAGAGAGARAVSARRPPPRNTQGLAGVSDKTKSGLVKSERRAVLARNVAADKGRIKFSANSIGQSFRFLGR